MKNFYFFLSVVLSVSIFLLLLIFPASESRADSFFPFKEHPIGSFFSKNKSACGCHKTENCVESGKNCNCLRYYTYRGKTYDLLGVQCVGFARMCQLRLFGFYDYGKNADKFYNLAGKKLSPDELSASVLREIISKAPSGSHIRIGSHSLIIVSSDSSGFTSYECNSSVSGRECMVFSRRFTYSSFFSEYAGSSLHYVKFPKRIESQSTLTATNAATVSTFVNTTQKPLITSQISSQKPVFTPITDTNLLDLYVLKMRYYTYYSRVFVN